VQGRTPKYGTIILAKNSGLRNISKETCDKGRQDAFWHAVYAGKRITAADDPQCALQDVRVSNLVQGFAIEKDHLSLLSGILKRKCSG